MIIKVNIGALKEARDDIENTINTLLHGCFGENGSLNLALSGLNDNCWAGQDRDTYLHVVDRSYKPYFRSVPIVLAGYRDYLSTCIENYENVESMLSSLSL